LLVGVQGHALQVTEDNKFEVVRQELGNGVGQEDRLLATRRSTEGGQSLNHR
jgi:hypothetical protein